MDPISTFQLGCVLYVQKMRSGDNESVTVAWLSRLVAWFLRAIRKMVNAFANRAKQEQSQPIVKRVAN